LWRVVCPRREDDLALCPNDLARSKMMELDPDRPRAFQHHPRDRGVGDHLEVRAPSDRMKISRGCAAASAVALGQLETSGPQLSLAIEVVVPWMTRLNEGLYHSIGQGML